MLNFKVFKIKNRLILDGLVMRGGFLEQCITQSTDSNFYLLLG